MAQQFIRIEMQKKTCLWCGRCQQTMTGE